MPIDHDNKKKKIREKKGENVGEENCVYARTNIQKMIM
jgi:hypothetical protein